MRLSKANWITIFLALGICALAAWYGPGLPDPVPSHWNARGEVDGWTAKPWGVWLVPLISSVVTIVLLALPAVIPAKFNRVSIRRRYDRVVLMVLVFMILFATAGWQSIQDEFMAAESFSLPPAPDEE